LRKLKVFNLTFPSARKGEINDNEIRGMSSQTKLGPILALNESFKSASRPAFE
jgi:hypothetical protein